jgi:glycosyltransferase involved in cell wall biosynthesis
LRILHVVPTYLPAVRYGGPIFSVHGLCKSLARRGHEVHVFTSNVDGPGVSDVPLGRPVDIEGVQVSYFRVPVLRRVYWSPAMRDSLVRLLGTFDIAHMHSVFLWPTWAAARVAARTKVPYVLSPRGMLVRALIQRRNPTIKKAWIRLIESRNLERASMIHVTSELEAQELAAFGLRLPRVRVIPNGIDLPGVGESRGAASPAIAGLVASQRYVLFLGRINWKKGLDRLVDAMASLPGARLIVAGNDEEAYLPALQAAAAQQSLSDRIRFIGPVYGADKVALLEGATAVVVPSYSENFGNVVLEAMAAGCPVITTPGVGAAEAVRSSGAGRVVEGDPKTLAAAIAALIGDPDAAKAMGKLGKQAVADNYQWQSVAKRMEAVYSDCRAPGGVEQ